MSRHVAKSITMIAGRFGHVGICQLRTKLNKLQKLMADDDGDDEIYFEFSKRS